MNSILTGLIFLAVPLVYVLYQRFSEGQRRQTERLERTLRHAQDKLDNRRRETLGALKARPKADDAADKLIARRERQLYLHAKLVQKAGTPALAKELAREEAARLGTRPSNPKALDAALRRISQKRAFSSFSRLSRLSRFSRG